MTAMTDRAMAAANPRPRHTIVLKDIPPVRVFVSAVAEVREVQVRQVVHRGEPAYFVRDTGAIVDGKRLMPRTDAIADQIAAFQSRIEAARAEQRQIAAEWAELVAAHPMP